MLNKNFRWIKYYDLVLRPSPFQSPPIKMEAIIRPLEEFFQTKQAYQLMKDNTVAYRIQDFCYNEQANVLILLLQYADMNASEPAFSDIQTGRIRTEPKLEGEGIAVSAHVVVSLDEQTEGSNVYITLIEEVPGLNRTVIERFLTHIFMKISEGRFTFEDINRKTRDCRPIAELQGRPSDSLKNALKTGVLKEIQLIKRETVENQLDTIKFDEERIVETRIKIGKGVSYENSLEFVNKYFAKAKNDATDEMRISYHDPKTERRESVIVDDFSTNDIDNTLFVRREKVELEKPLQYCEEHIRCDIIEHMFSLLPETNRS